MAQSSCNNLNTDETVSFLKSKFPGTPRVGIICGSGLSSLADTLENPVKCPYVDIPNFPRSTVVGHAGELVFGNLAGVPVVCMKGRFHYYEGYSLDKVTFPVRVMKKLGITYLIVTNAAGGIRSSFKIGDIMLIKDHVNFVGLAGNSPLRGPNDDSFGPRFPPLNKAYDRDLLRKAKDVAKELSMEGVLHEGVYAGVGGPTYESIAELIMLKTCGCDSVGMSTVHEVVVAAHCGLKIFAFSLITDVCIMDYDTEDEPKHDEVVAAAKAAEEILKKFVTKMVGDHMK